MRAQHKAMNHSVFKYLLVATSFALGLIAKKPLEQLYTKKTEPPATATFNQHDPIKKLLEQAAKAHKQKNIDQAITLYKKALKTNPAVPRSLIKLAGALTRKNKYEDAVPLFKTIISIEPGYLSAYVSLGMCLHKLNKFDEAVATYKKALALSPNYADAHQQMSKALSGLKQFDQALVHGEKAVELQPSNIHTHLNLGHIYNKQGDLERAIEWYQKALTVDSNFANAHYNLGYTLKLQGNMHKAIEHLDKAIKLQSDYVDAHIALSHAHWSLGNYEKAWEEYEWRWKLFKTDPRSTRVPFWDGSDLNGKTILLYSEQGLGDTLQFVRFAKQVKKCGGNVVCKIQKPLKHILSSYPYIDKIITGPVDEKIDYQAPLLSLPGILKMKPETIPAEIPYLNADTNLVKQWSKTFADSKNTKIGLCWHVDPIHDIDKSPVSKRSVRINDFLPLTEIKNLSFYSLQKGDGEEQLKSLPQQFTIKTFGPDFDKTHGSFMDSAAIMHHLDLIITVDTSVAHVAAAMGKEVWMLLPYSPDCRWSLHKNDTAWYPSMRLFRQSKPFDWQSVIHEIKIALVKKLQ